MADASVSIQCHMCAHVYTFSLPEAALIEWRSPERTRTIQEIFPDLPPAARELFLSQTCDSCFKTLFPPEPEEEPCVCTVPTPDYMGRRCRTCDGWLSLPDL